MFKCDNLAVLVDGAPLIAPGKPVGAFILDTMQGITGPIRGLARISRGGGNGKDVDRRPGTGNGDEIGHMHMTVEHKLGAGCRQNRAHGSPVFQALVPVLAGHIHRVMHEHDAKQPFAAQRHEIIGKADDLATIDPTGC